MNIAVVFLVSFLTGILASMGLGGGMILILYLTFFASVSQIEAQGINLLFFLPIAALSLIFHTRAKLVMWREILPTIITGCVFSVGFSFVAVYMETTLLSKLFGGFVALMGLYMLWDWYKNRKNAKKE